MTKLVWLAVLIRPDSRLCFVIILKRAAGFLVCGPMIGGGNHIIYQIFNFLCHANLVFMVFSHPFSQVDILWLLSIFAVLFHLINGVIVVW